MTSRERITMAASFQEAAVETVLAKVDLAIERTGAGLVAAGGGVTANTRLREGLARLAERRGVDLILPPRELCTDNAAMGAIAWERLERGESDSLELEVVAGTDRRRAAARPAPTAQ